MAEGTEMAIMTSDDHHMPGAVARMMMYETRLIVVETMEKEQMQSLFSAFQGECLWQEESLLFSCDETRIYQVLDYIKEQKIFIRKIERLESSLETLFLEVVQK